MNNRTARGAFRLAEQVGQFGYFAAIELVVEISTGSHGEVRIELPQELPSHWRNGLVFGIDYALGHARIQSSGQNISCVRVENLETNPVDTSSVLLAFVAAKAVCSAIHIEPPARFTFVPKDGAFLFPK